jgi:hypothetical protein
MSLPARLILRRKEFGKPCNRCEMHNDLHSEECENIEKVIKILEPWIESVEERLDRLNPNSLQRFFK